jgi:hypothetical protein
MDVKEFYNQKCSIPSSPFKNITKFLQEKLYELLNPEVTVDVS